MDTNSKIEVLKNTVSSQRPWCVKLNVTSPADSFDTLVWQLNWMAFIYIWVIILLRRRRVQFSWGFCLSLLLYQIPLQTTVDNRVLFFAESNATRVLEALQSSENIFDRAILLIIYWVFIEDILLLRCHEILLRAQYDPGMKSILLTRNI